MNTRKLQQTLRRMGFDTKKLIAMGVLLAVGLLLWGRLLLKEVPRTASAGPTNVTVLVSESNLSESIPGDRQTIRVSLPDEVKRDLFSFDPSRYRRTTRPAENDTGRNSGLNGSDEASRLAAVKEAAGRLRLGSVMMGDAPHAWINGVAVAAGELIEGFTVLQISDRHVLLKKDGFVIRLKM